MANLTKIEKTFHKDNFHNGSYPIDVLCEKVPDLKNYLTITDKNTISIDFTSRDAVVLLNKALLYHYYNVNFWNIPDNNLCPPIPGRVDYIHYLHDVLIDEKISNKDIKVLDIGTGASLIYPILGTSVYNWNFVGSDISEASLKNAQIIIDNNAHLHKKISLIHQRNKKHILLDVINKNEQFTFTMCNPPFFKSSNEATKQNLRKNDNLKKIKQRNFSGIDEELWCDGGELTFVKNYIKESMLYKNNVLWFTCLISNKNNLYPLKTLLKIKKAQEIKVVNMLQGNKTTRILMWKF